MKRKTTITGFLFIWIVWYETLTLFLATFFPYLENKMSILFLLYIYIYYTIKISRKHRRKFAFTNLVLIGYIIYFLRHSGMYYVTHLDFYCFIELALIFLLFSKEKIVSIFEKYLYQHKKMVGFSICMYFAILAVSIPYRNGLHTGFEMSIPLLYGPYTIPHNVAYELLFIYCLAGVCYRNGHNCFFLFAKMTAVLCTIWTGTRSAFVAVVILVIMDYLSIKNMEKKVIYFLAGLLFLIYFAVGTDLLINNPIVQKSISVINSGFTITNGRERFTQIVLESYWKNTDFIEKVFGMGIDGVRASLKADVTVNVAIHAHNDYINILCGFGIVGMGIMLFQQWKVAKLWDSFFAKLMAECFLIVLMYTNGLAMYCLATPCLPVFFLFAKTCALKNVR